MPYGNPFSSSNHAQFTSGVNTNFYQGGGDKKAGLAPSVGNDSWVSIFRGFDKFQSGRCCRASDLANTLVFTKHSSRPIGSDPRIPWR